MRPKYVFAVLLFFSLAVIAVLFLRALPQKTAAVIALPALPPEEVLVAARPLHAALFLRAQDVTWGVRDGGPLPGDFVRPSTARPSEPRAAPDAKPEPAKGPGFARARNAPAAPAPKTDDAVRAGVYGAALRREFSEGEPIRTHDIVQPGDRDFLPTVLREGHRALTIPVTATLIGSGLMFAGDQVDVMLTQTFKNDSAPLTRRSVSETVVEDLRVLAIAQAGSSRAANTLSVTLELLPQQAEKINVALELGKLSLSLRSVNEPAVAAAAPAAANSTNADAPPPPPPPPQEPTWAGDVSPALRSAMPPPKVVQAERPAIRVMRGPDAVETKTR